MERAQFIFVLVMAGLLAASCGGGGGGAEPAADEAPAPAADAKPAPDLSQAGSVSGMVSFGGDTPKNARLRMDADPVCVKEHSGIVRSQDVLIGDGGALINTFVWVKSGLEQYGFDTPSDPVTLDQKGCIYTPHVLGIQTRQKLHVLNSDGTTHNVHPLPRNNREWNQSQRAKGKPLVRSFPRAEVMIPVKCNVHPWMKAYIGVVPHPYYAVTGTDGAFSIENLPPGDYVIEAWHEKFGVQEQQVTVQASEAKEVSFEFSG
ncbi:MAG: carboxypeptidase regulatory-like domain-containing protein [Acidobacteriota bacterium]|nr:carboxypeptidase regulatory-like domain-containing protein [Acidobacteriota bacterium]